MGGIGFSLDLKRTGGDDALEVKELYAGVFQNVAKAIKRLAKGKACKQVTEEYLDLCEEDGDAVRAGDQLAFGFKDSGGCNMSSVASDHWFRVVIAALREAPKRGEGAPLDTYVARRGWKLTDAPEPLKKLLARCNDPLVEVKGALYLTGTLDGVKYLESDVGLDDAASYDALSPKDRARVDQVMRSKRCPCPVCEALRKGVKPVWPRDKPPPKAGAKPRRKKYQGFVSLCEPRWKALSDDLLASPEVSTLCLHAERVESLPDALAGLPRLDELRLEKTALRRVPAVLGRLPALRTLSLGQAPWETLADLPELPRLETLRVYLYGPSSPLVETIPWGRVPNLKRLYVGSSLEALPEAICDLEHLVELGARHALKRLPKRLGRLKALEELHLDCRDLGALPAALFSLPRLRVLRLEGCRVKRLPAELSRAPLVELHADGLRALPETIGDVATLQQLSVHGEELRALPASLGRCRALQELSTTGPLEALPDLSGCKQLAQLHLDRTRLPELPRWLKKLPKLFILSMGGAPMPVPGWIDELPALQVLRVSKDQLGATGREQEAARARLTKLLERREGRLAVED